MACSLYVGTLLAVLIPDAIGLVFFSAIGISPTIYSAVADSTVNLAGNGAAGITALWLAFLFVIDFHLRSLPVQLILGFLTIVLIFGTAILKACAYPWVPGLLCLCLTVGVLGWMRASASCFSRKRRDGTPGVRGKQFFTAASIAFFVCALLVTAVWAGWLILEDRLWSPETKIWLAGRNQKVFAYVWGNGTLSYEKHCSDSADISNYDPLDQRDMVAACVKAANVWFLQWSGPFVVLFCNGLAAVFCSVFAMTAPNAGMEDNGDGNNEATTEEREAHVKRLVKYSAMAIALLVDFLYASATYVSGSAVKLSSAIVGLGSASLAAIVGWIYLELDHEVLENIVRKSKIDYNISKAYKNDWVRAFAVTGLNLLMPIMYVLDMLRQKQRLMTGHSDNGPAGKLTKRGQKVIEELANWYWVSILTKVNILAELMASLLVGMKVTFVFFSWLNEFLVASQLSFWIISAMVFGIGLGMFLCPIVPGSAVYLFAGVVLGASSQVGNGPGFWPGVGVAVAVSSVAKHIACILQYMLGYFAGQMVKVQQFVGVDKVPTRAMEKILKSRGMGLGKVCILVAGPDFPTSMLCGILKLNIPQMLLGTTPVILVSIIPQVLVGALLMMTDAQAGIWSMVSTSVTGVAAAVQAGATLIFTWKIMKTVERDAETLMEYRPEHKAVAELTEKEAAYTESLKEVTQWQAMSFHHKATLLISALGFMAAGFVLLADFMVSDKFCFRVFSITDKIGDPYELGGLDGNALNLVMRPAGVAALLAFAVCFVLHMTFNRMMSKAAWQHLRFNREVCGWQEAPIVLPVDEKKGKVQWGEVIDEFGTQLVTI
eukprot:gb/GFBE01015328.1/.p1 GENE.gb/GFBE01015328.1/~~gb/GFBE01015328.1/.p1  ORF type:complete len:829 (+),score=164.68 gb/GFBE01015328.1/:1-2487(+)